MYIPRHFEPPDVKWVAPFIRKNSFALVMTHVKHELRAVHIPLEIDEERNVLSGHIARANNISEAIDGQTPLMAVFMHQHAYVSSSWYSYTEVPTWNYIAVHINGVAKEIVKDDLRARLEDMVEHYESGRPNRFHLSDMSDQMIERQMRGIVGFDMEINSIEAKYKLSQNRNTRDYDEIINQLQMSSDPLSNLIAEDMRKLKQ